MLFGGDRTVAREWESSLNLITGLAVYGATTLFSLLQLGAA